MNPSLLPVPNHILSEIFSYDPTYREVYDNVVLDVCNAELRALLSIVPNIKQIQFKNDVGDFLVKHTDSSQFVYQVLTKDCRYSVADYSDLVEFDTDDEYDDGMPGGHTNGNIEDAATIYGWADLLGMDEEIGEVNQQCYGDWRDGEYYIYKTSLTNQS